MNISKINTQNFTGSIVIAGNKDELAQIDKEYSTKLNQDYYAKGRNRLREYNGIHLLPKDYEPVGAMLVATNEDARPLVNIVGKNCTNYNFLTYPKQDNPYKYNKLFIKANFRNSSNKFLDTYHSKNKPVQHFPLDECKTFVRHYAYEREISLDDFKKLKACDVLDAIKQGCFDFANGVIKTAKRK